MAKKIIFLLLIIFNFKVSAAQIEDKTVIDLLDVKISFLDKNKYMVVYNYDISTILGITPNERYFYKLLKNKNNKDLIEYDNIFINSKANYGINNVDDGKLVFIGDGTSFMDENQNITISWESNIKNNENNVFYITDEKYDIKKISFEVLYPESFNNKKVLFSINNKEYKENLEGLDFYIEKGLIIRGTYDKTISENNSFSFKIIDKKQIVRSDFIIYIVLLVVIIILVTILLKKILIKKSSIISPK